MVLIIVFFDGVLVGIWLGLNEGLIKIVDNGTIDEVCIEASEVESYSLRKRFFNLANIGSLQAEVGRNCNMKRI